MKDYLKEFVKYAEANLNDGQPLSDGGAMVSLEHAIEVLGEHHLEAITAAEKKGREDALQDMDTWARSRLSNYETSEFAEKMKTSLEAAKEEKV